MKLWLGIPEYTVGRRVYCGIRSARVDRMTFSTMYICTIFYPAYIINVELVGICLRVRERFLLHRSFALFYKDGI